MLNIIELNLVSVFRIQFNFHFGSCLGEDFYFTIMLKFTFSFLENLECIKGDKECSIGSPTTPSLNFLDIPIFINISK